MSLVLDYSGAHSFVVEQRRLGADVRWDGWDIVIFKPTPSGESSQNGAFHKGRWGVEHRVGPDANGTWTISNKNIRRPKKK